MFRGALAGVTTMPTLTDLVVARVFPLLPLAGTKPVAWLRPGAAASTLCVGTRRTWPGGGQAVALGFRPRDDQAASTGVEARTWFEILHALGAYPASGVFAENDNPTVISRTSDMLACSFPNGTVALCPHYRHHEESWPGGFFRDEEDDRRILAENPLPDDAFDLRELHIAGQAVTYHGRHAVAWRRGADHGLLAFSGRQCTGIELDGRGYSWSDRPLDIAWHPLGPEQALPGCRPLYRVWCGSRARVRVPLNLDAGDAGLQVWLGALVPGDLRQRRREVIGRAGYGQRPVPFQIDNGALVLDIDDELREHWLYVVRASRPGRART